jgi:hypothetical protein
LLYIATIGKIIEPIPNVKIHEHFLGSFGDETCRWEDRSSTACSFYVIRGKDILQVTIKSTKNAFFYKYLVT